MGYCEGVVMGDVESHCFGSHFLDGMDDGRL